MPLSRQSSTKSTTASSAANTAAAAAVSAKTLRRRAILLLLFLLSLLAISLLPGLALLPSSSSRHSLSSQHYLSIVDESQLSPRAMVSQEEATADAANTSEALNSLSAALELRKGGNLVKAKKIFRHALSLAPRNALVLLHYGELMEEREQLVEADHYYAMAVAYSADSDAELRMRATALREATASKVQELDDAVLNRIDVMKRKFLEVRVDSAAMRRAKKEAYFQYIYHTVGIEGNTLSLSQTRAILETRLAVLGKSILEHNEILGMEAALKYINNTLIDKYGDITVDDILEIHRRVIGNVDPIEAGMFRRTQVYVSDHQPPPSSLLSVLMAKFVTWLNYPSNIHPVRLAALAHYKLVFIHPFMDGNGRTSRLLMNLVLMKAGFPPVIIRRADREAYYRHLQTANEGDVRPFIRFIALCTEKTLEAYLWASKEYTMEDGAANLPPNMVENAADLPPNLVEHSAEAVRFGLERYRASQRLWLNLAGDDEDGDDASSDDPPIQMGGSRRGCGDNDCFGSDASDSVVLTMDEEDVM